MFENNDSDSSFDIDTNAEVTPVFCIGLDKEDVYRMRRVVTTYKDDVNIKLYWFRDHNVVPDRVGLEPRTIVVNNLDLGDPSLSKFVRYVRANHIPLLRVMQERVPLVQLPNSDYYNGVFETVALEDLTNSRTISSLLELGIRIYDRTRGDYHKEMSDFVKHSLQEILEIRNAPNADFLLKFLLSR